MHVRAGTDGMLTKISINNYRSCRNVVMEPSGPMMVLVGRNGVGKSNLLKAISWAAQSAVSPSPIETPHPFSAASTRVALEFFIGSDSYAYDLSARRSVSARAGEASADHFANLVSLNESVTLNGATCVTRSGSTMTLRDKRSINIPPDTACLPLLRAFLPPDDQVLASLQPVVDFLSRVRYYTFDEPSSLPRWNSMVSEDEYKTWATQRYASSTFHENTTVLQVLQAYLENEPLFGELLSLLGRDGLCVVDEIKIQKFDSPSQAGPGRTDQEPKRRWYFLTFVPSRCGSGELREFDFGDLSLGTRRVIRIITSLLCDRGTVLLGEHPEDGIHMGLTRKLMGLLRSYCVPGQNVILSSHSLVVFNTLQPEDVRLVTMTEGETSVRALSHQEVFQARKFIEEEGTLSDVLESIQDE